MLRMLGSPRRCCDGITRRETLQVGGAAALGGWSLPQLLQADELSVLEAKAKSVIFIFLLGGAATQDMFDLKPEAPAEVRSVFNPIDTVVPGIQICEHLPRLAQWTDRTAIIRSVNHKAGCHNCMPLYTGFDQLLPDQHPRVSDSPSMGSVCEYLKPGENDFPAYLFMPCWLGWGQSFRRSGPYGGYLGKRYDALTTECMPTMPDGGFTPAAGTPQTVLGRPLLPASVMQDGLTLDRLSTRRSLLDQLDDQRRQADIMLTAGSFDRSQQQAFNILTSAGLRDAFDIEQETPELRDRYGRTLFGESTLIARRLVERGVKFINVTWDLFWGPVEIDYDAWDTHTNNFEILKTNKLPGLDQTLTALFEDLDARGLLDETLIVLTSEMGRTPRINGSAGRDHWTFCYSSLLAGAGIRGGQLYGSSDSQAGYVADLPVRPADICATVYHCLGINPDLRLPDLGGRPVEIANGGRVIEEIMV